MGIDEFSDEAVGVRLPGSLPHLLLAGIGTSVQEVVAHRAVQQRGGLGDQADLRAPRILLHAGDIDAFHRAPPGLDVVEAHPPVLKRRLAGAPLGKTARGNRGWYYESNR